jgi:hypothetical protein
MVAPTRFPEGVTNAAPWQFFSEMGNENPFFYHSMADDFDIEPNSSVNWVASGVGIISFNSADGGTVTLETSSTVTSYTAIQRKSATFQPIIGKKLFFVARIALTDVINSVFVAGLIPLGDNPFGSVPNGIWIAKAPDSTNLSLVVINNSVMTANPFPTSAYTLTNNTFFDIGFCVCPDIKTGGTLIQGSIAPTLVSYVPQSGTGTADSTERSPVVVSTAPLLTTLQSTVLAPVVGVETEDSVVNSITLDFVGCFRER